MKEPPKISGAKGLVINCLHIKGSWTGLLMNIRSVRPHAAASKRFSVPKYKMTVYSLPLRCTTVTEHFQTEPRGC